MITNVREPRNLSPTLPPPRHDAVFVFYGVTWDGAIDRGMMFPEERLALELMRHPDIGRLLVADCYRSRAAALVRRARGIGDGFPVRDDLIHVSPLRMRRTDPTSLRRLRRASARYTDTLARAAADSGLTRPAVVVCNPLVAAFGDFSWAGMRTYYGWDCWAAHYGEAARHEAYVESYRRLHEDGWRVAAVTQPIIDRIGPTAAARVVPNGVTPEEWRDVPDPPAWYAALPGPRLLYVGSLDRRLDVAAVQAAARRFPGGSVVLIGVNYDPAHLAPLADEANVHVVPPVPREQIPAITMASDAVLVPHMRTALTESMSPLKLYEGLAGGRPVIATDLAPMRGIDDRVVLVDDTEDFADAVEAGLRLGAASEDRRLAFVEEHSWRRRFDGLIDLAVDGLAGSADVG